MLYHASRRYDFSGHARRGRPRDKCNDHLSIALSFDEMFSSIKPQKCDFRQPFKGNITQKVIRGYNILACECLIWGSKFITNSVILRPVITILQSLAWFPKFHPPTPITLGH